MTKEDLADKTELSFHSISSTERGINMPTLKTLEKISKALNISISNFYEALNSTGSYNYRNHRYFYTLDKKQLSIILKQIEAFD